MEMTSPSAPPTKGITLSEEEYCDVNSSLTVSARTSWRREEDLAGWGGVQSP